MWSVEGIFQQFIYFEIVCMIINIHNLLTHTCAEHCVLLTHYLINRIIHPCLNKRAQLHLFSQQRTNINRNVLYATLQYRTCHA
jgi:hypothetical protein